MRFDATNIHSKPAVFFVDSAAYDGCPQAFRWWLGRVLVAIKNAFTPSQATLTTPIRRLLASRAVTQPSE